MEYLSIQEISNCWNISPRRIQVLCAEGRILGAIKIANSWVIPSNALKPADARNKLVRNNYELYEGNIVMERIWAMPNKNTFEIKPIKELILSEKNEGLWIDPFANKNKFADITNDLSLEFDTTYHLDALDFLRMFEDSSIDGVLYDPPYSPRQVSECYNNVGIEVTWDMTKASFWGNHKKELSRIVKLGGTVITFGWNSGGIGKKYGFQIQKILLVPHGGWHNDTICTVEKKVSNTILSGAKSMIYHTKQQKKKLPMDTILKEEFNALPENFWDFSKVDTKEYTHGLHTYPAVMVSPISRNIIKIISKYKKINALYDPFAGSGTVLVEGMLANIPKITGTDINPLALFLTKVKTTKIDIKQLSVTKEHLLIELRKNLDHYSELIKKANEAIQEMGYDVTLMDGWGADASKILTEYIKQNNFSIEIPVFKNLGYWFKPSAIIELSIIKNTIEMESDKDIKDFFFIAFSEIIRLVSNRKNGEFKMYRMPADKVQQHNPDTYGEFEKIIARNFIKMYDFVQFLEEMRISSNVTILNSNACHLENVEDDYYDLVITSPPYGDSRTTVAYGQYSRLSLQWMNFHNLTDKEITGIDTTLMGGSKFRNGFEYNLSSDTLRMMLQAIALVDIERAGDVYSFYRDLEDAIARIAKKTKSDGYHFWVIGNRTVKNVTLETDKIIAEMASHYGMAHVDTIGRAIPNKVMPSKNSPTNIAGQKSATMTNEHIVILRKVSEGESMGDGF